MVNLPPKAVAMMKQSAVEQFEEMLSLLLLEPLPLEEQRKQMVGTGKVTGVVAVQFSELLEYHSDPKAWLEETISDKLVGHPMLFYQKQELIFAEPDTLYFKVTGRVSDTLESPSFVLVSGDEDEQTE